MGSLFNKTQHVNSVKHKVNPLLCRYLTNSSNILDAICLENKMKLKDVQLCNARKEHPVGILVGDTTTPKDITPYNDDVIIKSVDTSEDKIGQESISKLELDSHANMPVVGGTARIISKSGDTVDVSAYSPDYEPRQVPLVDAALQYDCPYDGSTHIMVIRHALYVPSMKNHLIPPFIMREAGIQVNEVPKIHQDDVDLSDHSIYFEESDFRIPLSLNGIFSYFTVSKPSVETLNSCEDVHLLTPTIN